MVADYAIVVSEARKKYGEGASILNGLNLAVPKGCIYGLLGASGCGKTTLLSSVVGVRELDSGEIWVLGGKPRSKESGIPGPRVGYMPQDVSLVDEFTVIGALYFFGRINGLDDYVIEERFAFLKDLLQLPPKNRLVKNMSGGQQRRLSFAAALLHKPELLILDEPTVGLDPVLRDNIWNHLVKITREDNVTVIITTHYIEEAKQSDKIGLMRNGLLLAESSPNELLERCHTESLEEAFLNLSVQAESQPQNFVQTSIPIAELCNVVTLDSIYGNYASKKNVQWRSSSKKRCKALFMKNALQYVRHPGGVLFSVILPMLQLLLFFNSIGLDPKGMAISIVNEEAGNCDNGMNLGNITYDESEFSCKFEDLSCRLIHGINSTVLNKIYYDDYDLAVKEIPSKKSVGVMYFSRNFSDATQARMDDFLSTTNEDAIASQIEVMMYTPDRQISLFVQRQLYDDFFDEYKAIIKECHISPKFADLPVRLEDPVFGKKDQNYMTFILPPFLLTVMFVLSTSISSSIIITDRHSGVWDRILVQGVTTSEILITHFISQMLVILIQAAAALCMCFIQPDVEWKGSVLPVIGMTILAGICGMSYGFLISVLCTSHTLVNYVSVGSFYPLILLCGLMWPVEGMPKVVKWFSLILPVTIPGTSLRGVIEKGKSMSEPEVFSGFLVLSGWILGLTSICLFRLRSKSA